MYTDGLIEVFNCLDHMLGVEGLEDLVLQSATLTLADMQKTILDGVAAWSHGSLADDVSLVIFRSSLTPLRWDSLAAIIDSVGTTSQLTPYIPMVHRPSRSSACETNTGSLDRSKHIARRFKQRFPNRRPNLGTEGGFLLGHNTGIRRLALYV
jgi:hypothetical protein